MIMKNKEESKAPDGMIPFDIEKAKAGAKVVARNGRPVRILCYDLQYEKRIAAAILWGENNEIVYTYFNNGKYFKDMNDESDLFHPEPEMWVNIYKRRGDDLLSRVYSSKDEAINALLLYEEFVGTYKLVKE